MLLFQDGNVLRGLTVTWPVRGREVVGVVAKGELFVVFDDRLFFEGVGLVLYSLLFEDEEFQLGLVGLEGFLTLRLVHVNWPQFVVVLAVDEKLDFGKRDEVLELDEGPDLLHSVVD